MATAFSNENIKDKLCGGCECTGFSAGIEFIYAAPDSLTIEDVSTYGAGDARKIVQITLVDRQGKEIKSSIAGNDGDDTIIMDPSTLDLANGFAILATVVTNQGCISDGSVHGVGVNSAEGALGYWDKDNDSLQIGVSESE